MKHPTRANAPPIAAAEQDPSAQHQALHEDRGASLKPAGRDFGTG